MGTAQQAGVAFLQASQEHVVSSPVSQPRHHTPGGWRRVVVGLLVGMGFGALATRVIPREGRAFRGRGVSGGGGDG